MSYEEKIKILLNQGLIKKQKIDYPHIEALLFRAKKDLFVAKSTLEIDEEATYNYAYLAMLRCGRAIATRYRGQIFIIDSYISRKQNSY